MNAFGFRKTFIFIVLAIIFGSCDAASRCYDYTYTCNGCIDIFNHDLFGTAYEQCPDSTYYCQKLVVTGPGNSTVTKRCSLTCVEQRTYQYAGNSYSNFCCDTDFCNGSQSMRGLGFVSLAIIVFSGILYG